MLQPRIPLMFLLSCGVISAFAQEPLDSPIYKSYRPPTPSSLLRRSDVTYNVLHIFILERRANSGDAGAQQELGLRYLLGEGVSADTVKGAMWIRKAAEQNHADAQYNLAILLFNGWGVPWNPFEAYRYFRAAAEQGMTESQYVLSMLLTENLVVNRNWEEAYQWIKKAATAGHGPAKEALADFELRGLDKRPGATSGQRDTSSNQKKPLVQHTLGFVFLDPDSSTQNDATLLKDALREASPQLRRALGLPRREGAKLDIDSVDLRTVREAADEGSPEALTILGRNYERGIGVQQDLILASVYYIRATRMSSPRAPGLLARMIEHENYVAQLKSRVEQGDPDAQFAWAALAALRLDYLLAKDQGVVTEKQALELLNKAVNAKHVQAIIELGLCYYSGRWVEESQSRAVELWNRAVALGSKEARIRLEALEVRTKSDPARARKAVHDLESAAQAGSVLAQVALGYCYETGSGVVPSDSEAARLYRAAAQRGSQDAYYALKRMHDRIRPAKKEFQIDEFN